MGKFEGNFAGTQRTQGTVVKCYRCGKPGHINKNCKTKFQNKNNNNDKDMTGWWVDSVATRHITKTKEYVICMEDLSSGHKVYMGNNSYCDIMGVGSYQLNVGDISVVLNEVLYVPSMRRNLVSVPALTGKGFEVRFVPKKVTMGKKHGRTMFDGKYITRDVERHAAQFLLDIVHDEGLVHNVDGAVRDELLEVVGESLAPEVQPLDGIIEREVLEHGRRVGEGEAAINDEAALARCHDPVWRATAGLVEVNEGGRVSYVERLKPKVLEDQLVGGTLNRGQVEEGLNQE
ncbi:hypothetical protein EJ110_NYTH16182 [Nymphaea thermarum]|nr:hypothetical protein EJ110_NYTH16182 [Nymphaea thermarum]